MVPEWNGVRQWKDVLAVLAELQLCKQPCPQGQPGPLPALPALPAAQPCADSLNKDRFADSPPGARHHLGSALKADPEVALGVWVPGK